MQQALSKIHMMVDKRVNLHTKEPTPEPQQDHDNQFESQASDLTNQNEKMRLSQNTDLNGTISIDVIRSLGKNQHSPSNNKCLKFLTSPIDPFSKGKFYWDITIILMALVNAILIPLEIAFGESEQMSVIVVDYILDGFFFVDIFISFRTIVFDPKTQEPVKDLRRIAKAYVLHGKFFIDVISIFPFDVIVASANSDINAEQLSLIALIKLTRLLRLGKIVTFIRMKKSIKQGIQFVILAVYLILILHYLDLSAYFIFLIEEDWFPPKDEVSGETVIYSDYTLGYPVMLYYAALFLLANDPSPYSLYEAVGVFFCILVGSITLGILVSQFSGLIREITKRETVKNEEYDFMQGIIFQLQLPEDLSNKITNYYDKVSTSQYIIGKQNLNFLSPTLIKKIQNHQIAATLQTIKVFNSENNFLANLIADYINIQMFLSGDLIVKQGEEKAKFSVIIKGYVNVIKEETDLPLSEYQNLVNVEAEILLKENLRLQKLASLKRSSSHAAKKEEEKAQPMELGEQDVIEIDKNVSRMKRSSSLAPQNFIKDGRKRSILVSKDKALPSEENEEQPKEKKSSLATNLKRAITGTNNSQPTDPDEDLVQRTVYYQLGELDEGRFFGEISQLTNLKATASVYAMIDVICGQIEGQQFTRLLERAPILKKRLLQFIETYNDEGFKSMMAMLQNTFLFKQADKKTLKRVTFLFKQERHVKGRVILRKRERTHQMFFVKKGEIDVVCTFDHGDNCDQSMSVVFSKINKGGYFNMSNAVLKKFSLFDFVVASDTAELYILNAADLALTSKHNKELYLTLKSHAILYQVDGVKYDFGRFYRKAKVADEGALKIKHMRNMWKFFIGLDRSELDSLLIFKEVDNLYNLRRQRYILRKKQKFEQTRNRRIEEHIRYIKTRDEENNQAEDGLFNESCQHQIMKLIDHVEDGSLLINNTASHLNKIADEIELNIDQYLEKKRQRMVLKRRLEQERAESNLPLSEISFSDHGSSNDEFSDFREIIDLEKKQVQMGLNNH